MSKTPNTTAQVPEFVLLDPSTLVLGTNVRLTTREEVEADTAFITSVREQGVLSPVTAYRGQDGAPVVITGQRRTLASLITEQPHVPVLLYPSEPENLTALRQQWDENERRAEMSEDDRLRGIEQMSLLGLSAEQIAHATSEDQVRVSAALSVAGGTHRERVAEDGLTIEQAAALADFEDDPETVEGLIEAAQEGGFDHAAAQARWSRSCERVRAEAEASMKSQSITVLDPYDYSSSATSLQDLKDGDGNDLDAEQHATCAGHAVKIDVSRGPDGTAVSRIRAYCTGWRKNGHVHRYQDSQPGGGGSMSEEEKAERRRVIENNKAWDAAVEVRRAWLAKFATRKTPPAGAEALIAAYVTGAGVYHRDVPHEKVTAALSLPTMRKEVTNARTTKGRLTMLALLHVLGAWEAEASRSTWRSPSEWDRRIMAALIGWGYTPSEVEKILAPSSNKKG